MLLDIVSERNIFRVLRTLNYEYLNNKVHTNIQFQEKEHKYLTFQTLFRVSQHFNVMQIIKINE